MPIYKWRRRPTKYFGEVLVPFAEIEIQDVQGRPQAFAVQVDSGAVISLLRRSAAELLGVNVESGRRVELGAVGGGQTVAFMHDLQTRFENWPFAPVPFAIAESENAPNLLGRLGVFDRLQVDFDASLDETRISPLWLTEDRRRTWNCITRIEDHILPRVPDLGLADCAQKAIRQMLQRAAQILACAAGLAKLHRPYAGPLLVRSMYELAAQFEYLMLDPNPRAQNFLDFAYVTQYRRQQDCCKNPSGEMFRFLAQSPDRAASEPHVTAEFNRVSPRFLRGKSKEVWDSWYCMSIRDLAKSLDRIAGALTWENEYWWLYAFCSDWAHGAPFGMRLEAGGLLQEEWGVFFCCMSYYCRMLRKVSENMILTNEHAGVLDLLSRELG